MLHATHGLCPQCWMCFIIVSSCPVSYVNTADLHTLKWTVARWCKRGGDSNAHLNRKVRDMHGFRGRTNLIPFIGSPQNVPAFIEAVKRREKTLSGFGHRYVHISTAGRAGRL